MYSVPLPSSAKRRHDHGHDNDHIDARKKTRGAPISDEGIRDLKALLDDDETPTTATHSTRAVTVRAGSVVTFLHPQDTTKVIKKVRVKKDLRLDVAIPTTKDPTTTASNADLPSDHANDAKYSAYYHPDRIRLNDIAQAAGTHLSEPKPYFE